MKRIHLGWAAATLTAGLGFLALSSAQTASPSPSLVPSPAPSSAATPALKGDSARGKVIADRDCSFCHGEKGDIDDGETPRLAAQIAGFMTTQLQAYRSGVRKNEHMTPVAKNMTDENIADVAAFYSALAPAEPYPVQDAASSAAGQKLHLEGRLSSTKQADSIQACAVCHAVKGEGNAALEMPRLSAQTPKYLETRLKEYRQTSSYPSASANAMKIAVQKLTDADIVALSSYLSSLK
jgi:cytochrome c553